MENKPNRRLRVFPRSGFTLIQTLSVLAILAVIAAVAYPVIGHAVEGAREQTCVQRLRQIHLALELYANDHPGYAPLHRNLTTPREPIRDPRLLLPYLRSTDMFTPRMGKFAGLER